MRDEAGGNVYIYIAFIMGAVLGFMFACGIVDDKDKFTVPFTNDTFVREADNDE